ncbi:hypothetical protein HWB52_gp06 [Pseudomonas phage Littlefix]|uniref:Uncharacterized protein n=1 Tax=Pseudomonas phage Littlefix TaxID=2079289 RepID=A0A2K9VHI9_9CAUD|nr:hypothetical protein HWB52_gp06 [Pseudomonas phage Littlefix]AUV61821.1 hypothetical protein PsPhLittlefix_gp06 [Pseudomonas phage Littlefix]
MMQIKLTEVDIRAGIALYLTDRGITGVTADNLQVTFTAGRKGSGLTADVVTNPSQNGQGKAQGSAPVQAKEKSSADLPKQLGGTAGETSGVAGADEAAKKLEAERQEADAKAQQAAKGNAPEVAPEKGIESPLTEEQPAAPVAEQKPQGDAPEGGSLFS